MLQQFKTLERIQLDKLKSLEKEMDCCLVALAPEQLVKVSDEQLRKIRDFERENDTIVLAYRC